MELVTYWANCTALGDVVCTIPIIKALLKEQRLFKAIVPPKFYELFILCDIPEHFVIPLTAEEIPKFDLKESTLVRANSPGRAAYRMHLLDLFSVFPVNAILKPEEKWVQVNAERLPAYNHPELLPGPYVVVGTGYAVQSRKMPTKIFCEIVKYCKAKDYWVVLLGSQRQNSKNPIIFDGFPTDGCIDLIDKTTLSESLSIIRDAACVVGMDSGLIHLASLTDVPIVCGFTYVDPYYRAPFRQGSQSHKFYPVEPRGACKYCSNGLAMFGVEFDHTCPLGKNYECVRTLEAADFLFPLVNILADHFSQEGSYDENSGAGSISGIDGSKRVGASGPDQQGKKSKRPSTAKRKK